MPQGKHSKLQTKLLTAINKVVEERQIALALPELRCTFGGRSASSVCLERSWMTIEINRAAPDWTIKILSQTKVTGNILHCLKHGSRLGWLIDPDERSVLVYPPGSNRNC